MARKAKTYHYVISVQSQLPDGRLAWSFRTDVIEWTGDRLGAFEWAFALACEGLNIAPEKAQCNFWSLEPNELP